MACILLSVSAVSVQNSQAYRNMNMTCMNMIWAIMAKISGLDPSSGMFAPRHLKLLSCECPESGTEMDTTWKKEARTAKDDVATNSDGRAERDGAIVE